MKNFLKILTILFAILCFNKQAYACDALDIDMGTKISKITNYLDFVYEEEEGTYDEEATLKYRGNTENYCPKLGLDNTVISIFVYDSKVVGIQLETWNPEIKKNQIYEFAKNRYGDMENEVKNENWIGHQDLSMGVKLIHYTKYKDFGEIYESLDISNEEYIDFTLQEEVEEMIY